MSLWLDLDNKAEAIKISHALCDPEESLLVNLFSAEYHVW